MTRPLRSTLAALALAATAPFQTRPELLPEAPPGWRFERLDFPLSFAPELTYDGFEELYFAPGMFEPDSDSYFSYVLAMRLEEDVAVDEELLTQLLETYYRGLCRALGEGRQLERDPAAVVATVHHDGRVFVSSVEMVDPFVTGEALDLRLELSVRAGARHTELLALASPLPLDAPIWNELRGVQERWRAARPAPVFLNHLYLVPDAETYAAVLGSEFLREVFATSEERDTVRRDMSYSGVYFYGEHTYFELLPPGDALAQGQTGIAFGIETEGGTAALARELEARGLTTFPGPVTRELDGQALPWFEILGLEPPHESSQLGLFTVEYDPRFLTRWHAELAPQGGGITRRAVLARYAASLREGGGEEPLFADVTQIELALDEGEREQLLEVCRAFGWVVEGAPGRWICDGPQVRLLVRTADGPRGITGFRLALRRPVQHAPLELGGVTLRFRGAEAHLSFRPR